MKTQEEIQQAIIKAKEEYDEESAKANLTEQQVNSILKKRMALLHECDDMQAITNTLLTKYSSIKNCSLRQALDEFNIPADL